MNGPVSSIGPLGHDPQEVHEVTRRVFDDPIFETDPTLIERAMDRLLGFVDELFGRAMSGLADNQVIAWVIAGVALVLLLLAVWRWTRGLRVDAATPPDAADPQGRSPQDWLSAARDAEGRGDLDTALRYRYLAIVATLEWSGVIEPLPGRTIRELDHELRTRAGSRLHEVEDVGQRVEQVIFGGASADEDDLRLAERAQAALDRAPVGARR